MKILIKDFSSKCDQIRSFLRIWSHLPKKSLMKNIFCAVWRYLLTVLTDVSYYAIILMAYICLIFHLPFYTIIVLIIFHLSYRVNPRISSQYGKIPTRKSRKTDSFYAVLISHFWGSTECWRQCGVRQYGDCKNYIEHCETAKPLSYTEKTYCEPITLKKYTEKIHHLKNLAIHFL